MPAVFVHGNPETIAIWSELVPRLSRTDIVRLSPPGFGTPIPAGFTAKADEYRDWLARELQTIGEPIDLVGHDWGGLHVIRIAMERPELVRSWASDAAGGFDPDYVWHDLAQVWQTPDAGEQAIAQRLSMDVDARAKRLMSLGVSKSIAEKIAPGFDETMGRCVLALYRSAAQPALVNWGKNLHAASLKPGLVIVAEKDPYIGGESLARHSAARCNAKVAVLQGSGHWWMCEHPKRAAEVLEEFWSGLA